MKWYRVDWARVMFFILLGLTFLFILGSIWFRNPNISANCIWTAIVCGVVSIIPGLIIFADWFGC